MFCGLWSGSCVEDHADPCDYLENRRQCKTPKAMRVARAAMRITPIPVTAGIFETRQKHEGLQVTSGKRMATPKGPIPITLGGTKATQLAPKSNCH